MNSSEGLKGLRVLDSLINVKDKSLFEDSKDSSDVDSLEGLLSDVTFSSMTSVTGVVTSGRGVGVSQWQVSSQKPHMSGM